MTNFAKERADQLQDQVAELNEIIRTLRGELASERATNLFLQTHTEHLETMPTEVAHNFDPKRDVACTKGEYAQLVYNARRYEWLRDNMRRMPLGEAGTRHFFDQPGTMSFQEAVDEAKAILSPQASQGKPCTCSAEVKRWCDGGIGCKQK